MHLLQKLYNCVIGVFVFESKSVIELSGSVQDRHRFQLEFKKTYIVGKKSLRVRRFFLLIFFEKIRLRK